MGRKRSRKNGDISKNETQTTPNEKLASEKKVDWDQKMGRPRIKKNTGILEKSMGPKKWETKKRKKQN